MGLIFGKGFPGKLGFDFLDAGEVIGERQGQVAQEIEFGDAMGLVLSLRASSAMTVFLLLQSRRPMEGLSSGAFTWASMALR